MSPGLLRALTRAPDRDPYREHAVRKYGITGRQSAPRSLALPSTRYLDRDVPGQAPRPQTCRPSVCMPAHPSADCGSPK